MPAMTQPLRLVAGPLAALTLAACASASSATQRERMDTPSPPENEFQVTGAVVYRERIALTPAAMVRVEVVELTPEGSPGAVLGEQTIQSPSQVPIPFSVAIAPQRVRSEARYAVTARIMDGGRVFSTASPVPVLTEGHPSSGVQVLVRTGG